MMISPVDMTKTVISSAPSPASLDHEPMAMALPPLAIWESWNLVSVPVTDPIPPYQTSAELFSLNHNLLRTSATLTRLVIVKPDPDHDVDVSVVPFQSWGASVPLTRNSRPL